LPVIDPDLLKRHGIAKEDIVTIEIDLDDRISNVVKLSEDLLPPVSKRMSRQRIGDPYRDLAI
jgi:hypothetical protein